MFAFESLSQLVRTLTGRREITNIHDLQNARHIAFLRDLKKQQTPINSSLITPLDRLELVVFDIETTGFRPQKGDEIISIGAVKVTGTTITQETFYTLVKPTGRIPKNIVSLTSIDEEMTASAPSIREALIEFLHFTNGATLVAHHANHERNFMKHFAQEMFHLPFRQRIVDTAFLIQICTAHANLVTLDDVCEYEGIPIEARHHALGDAKMTAKVWVNYVKQAQLLGCNHLQDVYERFARL